MDSNEAQQIAALQAELEQLRAALGNQGLPAVAQQTLQRRIDAVTAQLAGLRGQGEPARPRPAPGRGAPAGTVIYGPQINGPVSAGRDVNIATTQTIHNDEATRSEGVVEGAHHTNTRSNAAALRQLLTSSFSDGELRDLCFDLGIDYESLPGQGKAAKARELAAYVQRYGQTAKLVSECRRLRPNVDWSVVT